jgi:serine protease
MTRVPLRRWRRAATTLAVAVGLSLLAGTRSVPASGDQERGARRERAAAGEDERSTEAARTLAQPIAPPAIDLGEYPAGSAPRQSAGARAGNRSLPYEPGVVIVRMREGVGAGARDEILREARATRASRPRYADFELLAIDPSANPEEVAATLARRPDVVYAQASYRVHPSYTPNDPLYSRQWNFPLINLEQAWDINQGATASVIVAVLDTGVAYRDAMLEFTAGPWVDTGGFYPALGRISIPFAAAPDLGGPGRFVSPRDFIWNDDIPVDMDGHGTHVSGTVGQLTNNAVGLAGIAFNVKIMPVKCISTDWDDIFDSPNIGTDSTVAQAIRYAADNGAKVINMSLGRSEGGAAPAVGEAMRYAVSKGAFIAVAGGNDYEDGNPIERLAEQAEPIDGATVVASVGPDKKRAYYSGVKAYIEIAAPGGNGRINGATSAIWQQTYDPTYTDTYLLPPSKYGPPRFDVFAYRAFQGTSMATPHVAGLAALMFSQGITSPAAIEAAMKRFAQDLGATGEDDEYGYGLIDARASLRGLGLLK